MPTALVTGANAGLGLATAKGLARAGFELLLAVRDPAKGHEAASRLRSVVPDTELEVMRLDLASLESVRQFATEAARRAPRLDVLVNNAGVTMRRRTVTVDGFETTFGVNHLGHFLLTNLLHDSLAAANGAARVVVVASDAHRFARDGIDFDDLQSAQSYSFMRVYGASKLANILFTRELARRWHGSGITANSVHPGFVATRLARDGDGGRLGDLVMTLAKPFARTPEKGARTAIKVATAPELAGVTGKYFANEKVAEPAPTALDDQAALRLWEVSASLVGLPA